MHNTTAHKPAPPAATAKECELCGGAGSLPFVTRCPDCDGRGVRTHAMP